MKKTKKPIARILLLVLVVVGCSLLYMKFFKTNKGLLVSTWENVYNENNINLFYMEENALDSSTNLKALNETYNIQEIVSKVVDEKEKVLKTTEILNDIIEYDDVADSISLNGNGILKEKGTNKKVSGRDMAYIERDVLLASGFISRIGEFRQEDPQFENIPSYYVVEYWSPEYKKWIMIDFRDEGYFEKENNPLSATEVIDEKIKDIIYIGNDTQNNFRKKLNKYLSSYTIAIDNTLPMENSNSYITYIKDTEDIHLKKDSEFIKPTIFTTSKSLFEMNPTDKATGKDTKAYLILMKKPVQETTVISYVVAGFKDGAVIDKAYLRVNGESFEKFEKYKDIEIKEGTNDIELSLDGVNVISKIVIENNK
ncbi:hypothetical protein [Clostridium vincentii]|uniref:Transglutaminase-like superfamily protein n=1 Tax=Clostridium vincentii TaxID=52704 RepID=A0A2T0BBM3_9CLOT|nr:hypothetical protein [Clostridium vincentii]PRR81284.1 hypothetical protein CLVI_26030 [Clostridium vincentii]